MPSTQQLQSQLGMDTLEEGTASFAIPDWINEKISDPMLWYLNRRSVTGGVAVGLFVAWLPLPMQMLVAAILAALLRVHVPISVVLVWFSNPITFPVLLYAAWFVGSTLLGTQMLASPLSMSITELMHSAVEAWPEILFGSIFCAGVSAVLGYFASNVVWRILAIRRWKRR